MLLSLRASAQLVGWVDMCIGLELLVYDMDDEPSGDDEVTEPLFTLPPASAKTVAGVYQCRGWI